MWNMMQDDGWSCIKGRGLVEWYYLHPTCKGMKKSHLLDEKKEGTDYFTSKDDLKCYARLNLGWGASRSDDITGESLSKDRKIKKKRNDSEKSSKKLLNKGTGSECSDLEAQEITPPPQTKSMAKPKSEQKEKQEETDDDDEDGQTLYFFQVVMSGIETDNVIELPRKQDLTFADLRREIEEEIDLPWDSFKFTLTAGGTVSPNRKQEEKRNVCCRDYGLTKKGDGSCERPYLVFIKEAS